MKNSHVKRRIGFVAVFILLFILAPILSKEETASPGALYLLLLFLPMSAYALMRPNQRIRQKYAKYAWLYWISMVLSAAIGSYGHLDIGVVKGLMFVVFFITSTSFFITTKELCFLYKTCFIVSICLAILIVLSYVFGFPHNDSSVFMPSYSIGITGLYKNPNYLASFINIVLLAFLYLLFFRRTSLVRKVLMIGVVLLILVAFFFSGVRASFLTFMLSFTFVLLETIRRKKASRIKIVLILSVVSFVVIVYYLQDILELFEIFTRSKALLEDNVRVDSWSIALGIWRGSPVWGCGSGSWAVITKSRNAMLWLHNVFLELLLEQGIIGIFLLAMILFSGYKRTKREDRFFLIALMAVSGIPLLFQNGVNDFNFWRFVLINRVAFNYSIQSETGIIHLISGEKL